MIWPLCALVAEVGAPAPRMSIVRVTAGPYTQSVTRAGAQETNAQNERSRLPRDATRTSHTEADPAPRSATVRI
jgi:hypothetical protein